MTLLDSQFKDWTVADRAEVTMMKGVLDVLRGNLEELDLSLPSATSTQISQVSQGVEQVVTAPL